MIRPPARAARLAPLHLLLVVVLALPAAAGVFDVRYEGDTAPADAEPPWKVDGTAESVVDEGVFRFETPIDGTYNLSRDWGAEPGKGTYVHLRMRLVEYRGNRTLAGAALRVADGAHEMILIITPDYVYVFGTRLVHRMDTTDGFHDYRLSTIGTDFHLEVDGEPALDGTGLFSQVYGHKNVIQFGDQSPQAGAVVELDALRYAFGRTRNAGPAFDAFAETEIGATEGQAIALAAAASDADGDELLYRAEDLPDGATLDPASGRLEWTPPYDAAGRHEVTIVATDGELEARRTYTITVANVDRAPEFVSPRKDHVVYETGATIAFNIRATDPDGDDLEYSAEGLPDGARFDPSSKIFRWTPTDEQIGHHPIVFKASDGTSVATRQLIVIIEPGD